jgi:rod shape-determining protein MreC
VHDKQIRRRRAVLGLLVAASLILLTAYFGESPSSPLHAVQRGIVEVLTPVQTGASKVLSPVRDIAGWFSDTLNAKSQNSRLKRDVAKLTQQVDRLQYEQYQNQQLRGVIHLDATDNLSAYSPMAASVIERDPVLWYQTIQVDKGFDDGVRQGDPVVGSGGLVGDVAQVGSNFATVRLITDDKFAVAALVEDGSGDTGVLAPQVGEPNQLVLQSLPPHANIQYGQQVVTAGFRDPNNPSIESQYPPGIPIGQVSNANTQSTLINSQEVEVSPFVDLRRLSVVQILTRPHPTTQSASLTPAG